MVTLFEHLSRQDAETFSLVLNAEGIGHRVSGTANGFRIDVPESMTEAALAAIRRYQSENAAFPLRSPTRHQLPAPLPLSGIVVALALLTIHLAVVQSQAPGDYPVAFGADARRILDGQVYRCATALLIHADATHIAANMAGIVLFGGFVCSLTGTGVGWLMMLASGILGNLMNACAYQGDHRSVGASTAIFGALGILCAIQVVEAVRTGRGWRKVALIMGAGAALLALLGTGARSDVGAHLFGWLCGALLGGAYGVRFRRPLGKEWQVTGGVAAIATLLAAWIRGATG